MQRLKDFFYNNWKLVGLIVLLIFVLVLGIMLGNSMHNNDVSSKQYEKERKELLKQIGDSKKNAQLLIDSGGIYQQYAQNQAIVTKTIHTQTNKIKYEISKEISDINTINDLDSIAQLYSELANKFAEDSTRFN